MKIVVKNCYFFQNDLNINDNVYNISKLYFLKNQKIKIICWVHTGITFNKNYYKRTK